MKGGCIICDGSNCAEPTTLENGEQTRTENSREEREHMQFKKAEKTLRARNTTVDGRWNGRSCNGDRQRTIADNIGWLIILPVCGNGYGADNRRKKEQSFKPRAGAAVTCRNREKHNDLVRACKYWNLDQGRSL